VAVDDGDALAPADGDGGVLPHEAANATTSSAAATRDRRCAVTMAR
jgi:hypothetical protein